MEFSKKDFEKITAMEERLKNIEDLLKKIDGKIEKNTEKTENQLKIDKKDREELRKDVEVLKKDLENLKDKFDTNQHGWSSIKNKLIATILGALILASASYFWGMRHEYLKYQEPPNHQILNQQK